MAPPNREGAHSTRAGPKWPRNASEHTRKREHLLENSPIWVGKMRSDLIGIEGADTNRYWLNCARVSGEGRHGEDPRVPQPRVRDTPRLRPPNPRASSVLLYRGGAINQPTKVRIPFELIAPRGPLDRPDRVGPSLTCARALGSSTRVALSLVAWIGRRSRWRRAGRRGAPRGSSLPPRAPWSIWVRPIALAACARTADLAGSRDRLGRSGGACGSGGRRRRGRSSSWRAGESSSC